jgi:hypothetical protein
LKAPNGSRYSGLEVTCPLGGLTGKPVAASVVVI